MDVLQIVGNSDMDLLRTQEQVAEVDKASEYRQPLIQSIHVTAIKFLFRGSAGSSARQNSQSQPSGKRSNSVRVSRAVFDSRSMDVDAGKLLILSVVISNPPRLISHLLFTQRFPFTHKFQASLQNRSSAAGEQAYCLVNLMAVAEFIGNLDLEGVVSARDNAVLPENGLMPIPVPMTLPINIGGRPSSRRASMSSHYSATSKDGSSPTTPVLSSSFTLRNHVEQQASALSSFASKVLTSMAGVMDSSIGGFGGLFKSMNVNLSLPGSLPSGFGFGGEESSGPVTPAPSSAQAAAPWNHPNLQSQTTTNSRETIDPKESSFSIKSLKLASMPNMPAIPNIPTLTRSNTPGPGDSRVSVLRPRSVRSMRSTRSRKSDVGSLFGKESTEEDDESKDMAEDKDENEASQIHRPQCLSYAFFIPLHQQHSLIVLRRHYIVLEPQNTAAL
ncbi:hypothetical protein DFJ43DRAFT_1183954 [Lentinula guzmanii]|uniref:VPS9 domain-containing protein n=1 Tax=Lentinula guzmanii TaxID=2804957 RepID=A0AA38N0S6_9AGAR|nr:hypothetical protein DFJ43DRAFT_1183954 [Lentinula guzmanii]